MRPAVRRSLVLGCCTFAAAFVTATIALELVQTPTAAALAVAVGVLVFFVAAWMIPPTRKEPNPRDYRYCPRCDVVAVPGTCCTGSGERAARSSGR